MAVNIFAQNKPVGSTPRNPFDGQASRVFSQRSSVVRPVFIQHTVPNSAYRINANDLVRTTSLQTAAFLRGKQELDFYFMPYSMIYSAANNVVLGRGDTLSPALSINSDSFPTIELEELFQNAMIPYLVWRTYLVWKDKVNNAWSDQTDFIEFAARVVANYLNFGVSSDANFIKAIKYVLNTCFYDTFLTLDNYASYNVSTLHFVGADVLHLLAACGYSDQYLVFKYLLDKYISNSSHVSTSTAFINACYPDLFVNRVQVIFTAWAHKEVNLLSLYAYQKVWVDNYRDSVNDSSFVYDVASSYDSFGDHFFAPIGCIADPETLQNNPLCTVLRPRLRMYERDLSCGLYVSPQDPTLGYGSSSDAEGRGRVDDAAGAQNANSAYAIKFAFAMQKYSEMLLKAGSRTKDILRAEFGVRSQYIDEHYSRYLGSFTGVLNMNTVQATSESGSYSVGDLAGNIFSSINGNTIEFNCTDYGIIVGVLSFVAKPLHNAFGVDKFNSKTDMWDFYHEAFANLGLVPVDSSLFSLFAPGNQDFTLGYSARDFEYKQNLDLVFGSFCTSPNLYDVGDEFGNSQLNIGNGSNSNYVLVRPISQTLSTLKSRVYQMPDIFDTVFTVQDGQLQDSEHFDVALDISCQKILPMPVMGMM